jgi:EmrB/QacA subfamily drug resistance transporter
MAQTEERVGLGFTHRQILVTMSGLVIAMLLAQLDNMIVAPALPTIVGDLGGLQHLAWVTTGYILATTVATPIWGKLGDMYGRRITFVSAVGLFLVGSALCGMAQNMAELVGFRAVQGLGAGGLIVGVLSIVGEMIPPRDRSKYQGVMMAVMPVALIGGPLIGGFITDHLSWRWAFYVNLPLGLIALVVAWVTLARLPRGKGHARIDWFGTGLLTVWITSLVLIATWGGTQYAWGSPQIIGLIVLTLAGLAAFIAVERRQPEPIMPLRVFKNRNFVLAGGIAFISGFALFGAIGYLPQYQQFVQGASATNSGLLLMPMMLAVMAVSLTIGQVIGRTGRYRIFPIVGSVLMLAALGLFAMIGADTPLWKTMLIMVVMGLGLGGNMQPMITAVQNAVSPREIGVATSSVTFFRSMGGTLGTAIFLSVLFNVLPGKIADALTAAARANPEQAPALQRAAAAAGGGGGLDDSSFINKLPEAIAHPFKVGFADGIQVVFLLAFAVMVVGLIVVLFLPEIPLANRSAQQQRADDLLAAENSDGVPGEVGRGPIPGEKS